eukprot:Opistho-2@59076
MSGCCGAQAHAHGNGHSHGGADAHDDPERGQEFSLYRYIDSTKAWCLNEAEKGSVMNCFKPWNERKVVDKYIESDADEQLIVYIPFTGDVKLKSICVIGGDNGAHPKKMKAFTNRDNIDFDNVEGLAAVQEWDLHEDGDGVLEYQTRLAKFQGLSSLILYFPENFGADTTRVYYIGLKGEFRPMKRDAIMTGVYEASANPADHKAKATESAHQQIH